MTGFIYAISGGNAALAQDARVSANLRRMVGSGILVAVGYIDPGNWATDIAGGSGFGYGLLMVVITSAFLALGFQVLVSRLALATGQDLATLTARHLSPRLAKAAWLAGEAAILASLALSFSAASLAAPPVAAAKRLE